MEYDAITIDTNIFDENGLNLESGMLKQLGQFGEGSAQFVLSEIVYREIIRHLTERGQKARDSLFSSIKRSAQLGLLASSAVDRMNEVSATATEPKQAAIDRFVNFSADSGCEIIRAEGADMKKLIRMYFAPSAPFEGSGSKKNEFPDAIALISLEDWAKTNSKKILAISKDVGWKHFAAQSEWIDVEGDLPTALQKFQKHSEQAREIVSELLEQIERGEREELKSDLESRLQDQVSDLNLYAEAASSYYFDNDQIDVSLSGFSFLREKDGIDFKIVQIGKNKIVARIGVRISIDASANFTFYVQDDEGDEVWIGASSCDEASEFNAGALVTIEGEFTESSLQFDFTEVELVGAIDSVDFGEIGPDYDG